MSGPANCFRIVVSSNQEVLSQVVVRQSLVCGSKRLYSCKWHYFLEYKVVGSNISLVTFGFFGKIFVSLWNVFMFGPEALYRS